MTKLNNLKKEVLKANILLWEWGLVVGTQGNVSGYDPASNLVVIKPSGLPYSALKIEDLVTINLEGKVVEGKRKPSVDWPHHIYIYKKIFGITGIAHTHSPFATAFATAGLPIKCLTTGQADIFGGEIPITPYVDNKEDYIGQAIVKGYRSHCPAVLLQQHGLFTFGEGPYQAVLSARFTEYFAQINLFAILLAKTFHKNLMPLSQEEIKKWYERYHGGGYGQ